MLPTYRRKATVRSDGRIEIKTPKLKPGTRVDVTVRVESEPDDAQERGERVRELKALFKETQALPQARTITEEEIAAEIAAYRAEQAERNK
jgi:type IV secretory pathway VirD2 relaxase